MHPSLISASLYVGDLQPEVTEAELLEIFNQCGPVASIRVLRDVTTRRSLGYAYVNYHQVSDAERALDTINYQPIHGKPIRIMWKHRDPAKRKSGVGNIFIKNLDKSIDSRSLNDTFSQFGNILSCKVATDAEGNSKGYGFVQYETKEAAEMAIEKVNGNMINDKRVFVAHFLPLTDRQPNQNKYTNLFIKNFDPAVTKEILQQEFGKYGTVTSAVVMQDASGASRCFGFVNFENPDSARSAVESMNGKPFQGGKEIYVGKAEKRAQREAELRKQWAARKAEMQAKFSGTNLYIKNLDDSITDDQLRSYFEPFGVITSCKVESDNGKSKGFGYVSFQQAEEATRAVTDMNGKIIKTKPIYVALHQTREARRQYLQSQNMQRFPAANMQRFVQHMMYPGPQAAGGQRPGQYFMVPGMGGPRFGGAIPRSGMPMSGGRGFARGAGGRRPQGQPGQIPPQGQRNIKVMPGVRNREQIGAQAGVPLAQPQVSQTIVPGALSKEQLASMLVTASQEQQKQLLGERLYALIAPSQPSLTGKITGMLLEGLDNGELLHLIDSPDALQAKIQEAISALHAHVSVQQ